MYKTFTTALSGEGAPPLVAGATTFPRKRGHYKAPLCCELLMKGLLFSALFCPPLAGEVRRSRTGGGERSEPIRRMPIMPYDTKSQIRNADFISIALRAIPKPSAQRAVKLKNPPAHRAGQT